MTAHKPVYAPEFKREARLLVETVDGRLPKGPMVGQQPSCMSLLWFQQSLLPTDGGHNTR